MNSISADKRIITLFEDEYDNTFVKRIDSDQHPKVNKKLSEGYFWIKPSAKKTEAIKLYFELWDNYIFFKKSPDKKVIRYMDINFAILQIVNSELPHNATAKALRFQKRNLYEELIYEDETTINKWYDSLKNFCALTCFSQYFNTINVLGEGSFAKVYLVERKSDKKEFAVKVFPKNETLNDPKERKSLVYEINMLRIIKHSRILNIMELYEGNHYIYCLCQYIRGETLMTSLIKQGAQTENKSLNILFQILQALDYLQKQKIIHRDIKPENIMLAGSVNEIDVKIIDLGFATRVSDQDLLFKRCGTPGYVAPEILQGKDYDTKADVFSAGVILYLLLFESMPFGGKDYRAIISKNVECKPRFDLPTEKPISLPSFLISNESIKKYVRKRSL